MLSGVSAGGYAAYYWADYLPSLLNLTKTRYVAASSGGYTFNYKYLPKDSYIYE